jgi:hypothetical protein
MDGTRTRARARSVCACLSQIKTTAPHTDGLVRLLAKCRGLGLRPFSPLDDARQAGGSLRVSHLGRRKARVRSGLADVRDFTTTRSSSVSSACPVRVDSSPPPPAPTPPANACPLGLNAPRFDQSPISAGGGQHVQGSQRSRAWMVGREKEKR